MYTVQYIVQFENNLAARSWIAALRVNNLPNLNRIFNTCAMKNPGEILESTILSWTWVFKSTAFHQIFNHNCNQILRLWCQLLRSKGCRGYFVDSKIK